jgi:hypothetical protein
VSTPEKPRRAKHLIDFDAPPRPQRDLAREQESLERVKRWVMSVLVVTTVAHLAVGLVVAAVMLDAPRPVARIGLCVIAGAFGVIGVALARLIHGRTPFTPWLLVGALPTVVGVWLLER